MKKLNYTYRTHDLYLINNRLEPKKSPITGLKHSPNNTKLIHKPYLFYPIKERGIKMDSPRNQAYKTPHIYSAPLHILQKNNIAKDRILEPIKESPLQNEANKISSHQDYEEQSKTNKTNNLYRKTENQLGLTEKFQELIQDLLSRHKLNFKEVLGKTEKSEICKKEIEKLKDPNILLEKIQEKESEEFPDYIKEIQYRFLSSTENLNNIFIKIGHPTSKDLAIANTNLPEDRELLESKINSLATQIYCLLKQLQEEKNLSPSQLDLHEKLEKINILSSKISIGNEASIDVYQEISSIFSKPQKMRTDKYNLNQESKKLYEEIEKIFQTNNSFYYTQELANKIKDLCISHASKNSSSIKPIKKEEEQLIKRELHEILKTISSEQTILKDLKEKIFISIFKENYKELATSKSLEKLENILNSDTINLLNTSEVEKELPNNIEIIQNLHGKDSMYSKLCNGIIHIKNFILHLLKELTKSISSLRKKEEQYDEKFLNIKKNMVKNFKEIMKENNLLDLLSQMENINSKDFYSIFNFMQKVIHDHPELETKYKRKGILEGVTPNMKYFQYWNDIEKTKDIKKSIFFPLIEENTKKIQELEKYVDRHTSSQTYSNLIEACSQETKKEREMIDPFISLYEESIGMTLEEYFLSSDKEDFIDSSIHKEDKEIRGKFSELFYNYLFQQCCKFSENVKELSNYTPDRKNAIFHLRKELLKMIKSSRFKEILQKSTQSNTTNQITYHNLPTQKSIGSQQDIRKRIDLIKSSMKILKILKYSDNFISLFKD